MNVLVTDAEQRSSLAVTRSLGRAGYRVHVSSHQRRPLAAASRHAAVSVLVPSALLAPAEYVDAVVDVVRRHRIEMVVPIAEQSLLALLPARDRLGVSCMPAPPLDALLRISDKSLLLAEAEKQGSRCRGKWSSRRRMTGAPRSPRSTCPSW